MDDEEREAIMATAIGWAYAYACNLVDMDIDIRQIEAPKMLKDGLNDLE